MQFPCKIIFKKLAYFSEVEDRSNQQEGGGGEADGEEQVVTNPPPAEEVGGGGGGGQNRNQVGKTNCFRSFIN